MIGKIIFVLGLCASGKTTYAERLVKDTDAYFIDEGFNPLSDPPFEQNYGDVIKELKTGRNCVVIEIGLCIEEIRKLVLAKIEKDVPEVEIEWVCIENNLHQANENVRYRFLNGGKGDVGGHIEINERTSRGYSYPENAKVIKMFKSSGREKSSCLVITKVGLDC